VGPIGRRPVPVGVVQPLDLLLGRVVQRAGALGLGQLRGGDGIGVDLLGRVLVLPVRAVQAVVGRRSLRPIMPSATSTAPTTQLKTTFGIVKP
jgi:hypothetical protein